MSVLNFHHQLKTTAEYNRAQQVVLTVFERTQSGVHVSREQLDIAKIALQRIEEIDELREGSPRSHVGKFSKAVIAAAFTMALLETTAAGAGNAFAAPIASTLVTETDGNSYNSDTQNALSLSASESSTIITGSTIDASQQIASRPNGQSASATGSNTTDPSKCAPGTEEIGEVTQKMREAAGFDVGKRTITLCAVDSIESIYPDVVKGANGRAVVSSEASANFSALGQAYLKDTGKKLKVGDSFRTNELQDERNRGGKADPNAAAPTGKSRHETGQGADFQLGGTSLGPQTWRTCDNPQTRNTDIHKWMRKHAPKYGLGQHPGEAWHWDTAPNRCTYGQKKGQIDLPVNGSSTKGENDDKRKESDTIIISGGGNNISDPTITLPPQETSSVPLAPSGENVDTIIIRSAADQQDPNPSVEAPSVSESVPSIAELFDGMNSGVESKESLRTVEVKMEVMTYNILGDTAVKKHHNGGGYSTKERLKAVIHSVREHKPGIVGFQEVQETQFHPLKAALNDIYDSYPSKTEKGSQRPIYWDKAQYELIDSGMFEVDRYGDPHTNMPWVKLLHKATGVEMYVFNVHFSAGGPNDAKKYGTGHTSVPPPKQRARQAKQLIEAINRIVKNGEPVVAMGDLNSTCDKTGNDKGVSKGSIPCMVLQRHGYTDTALQAQAMGVAENDEYATSHHAAGAPRKKNGRIIDHAFTIGSGGNGKPDGENTFVITGWKNIIDEYTRKASDHTPPIVDLVLHVQQSKERPATT